MQSLQTLLGHAQSLCRRVHGYVALHCTVLAGSEYAVQKLLGAQELDTSAASFRVSVLAAEHSVASVSLQCEQLVSHGSCKTS